MIYPQKCHQNDITPWESIQNDIHIPIFNHCKLARLQHQAKTQPTKHYKPNLNHKLGHFLPNTEKTIKKNPMKVVCNVQIPKWQSKISKGGFKGRQISKQTRFKSVELDFNQFVDLNQTAFLPNKQIKLQQMFPSYSLKKINRNATFYRHSGFNQISKQNRAISTSVQQKLLEGNKTFQLAKELNITNSQIVINSRWLTSKHGQQTTQKNQSERSSKQIKGNQMIIMKNEAIFHKIIESNKAKNDATFIKGLQTNYVHHKNQGRNTMFSSKLSVQRGRVFDNFLKSIRHKAVSSLEKDRGFFKGVSKEFVQVRVNKCLHLPKIELIQIIQSQSSS